MYGGDALGRAEGRVVMMPMALPGELVRFDIANEKPHLITAQVAEIVEPSAERVTPRCSHFGKCGGCQYQHTGAEYMVEQKRAILTEVFERMGKVKLPEGGIATASAEPWGYRNRIQLHIEERRIGFHAAKSREIEPILSCAIASPKLVEVIHLLREMKRSPRWPRFLRSLELFTNESEVQVNVLDSGPQHVSKAFFQWCAETMPGAMAPALDYRVGELVYRVSHKSFFQVNRFLLEKLVELAIGGAEGKTALDLYAGVGLFSLPLATRFQSVTAVEAVNSAVADLGFNADRHKRKVKTVRARTDDYLNGIDEAPDFVLADPPRAGLGKPVVDALVRLQPQRIHLVNCDPPMLARDLQGLIAGGYQVEGVTMVDLFPQTSHIESVTRLVRG